MAALFENNIILAGLTDFYSNTQVKKPYSDLARLLEPYGTISLKDSPVALSWMGGSVFVAQNKITTTSLTMRQKDALEELIKEFSGASVEPLIFVFSPVPTAVEFKYFPEEDTFKIYDWFNKMWRKFTLNVKVAGMEVDNKVGVHFTISNTSMDNKLTIIIYEGNLTEVLDHGDVSTQLEEFTLHTTHGFFDNVVLEPLPKDHPGAVVVVPGFASQYHFQTFLTARGNPTIDQYGNRVYRGITSPSGILQNNSHEIMPFGQGPTW